MSDEKIDFPDPGGYPGCSASPVRLRRAALSDEQLPTMYDLAINEERSGVLVFEVPAGYQDFSISFQEIFEDNTYGDAYFVFFTAEEQG